MNARVLFAALTISDIGRLTRTANITAETAQVPQFVTILPDGSFAVNLVSAAYNVQYFWHQLISDPPNNKWG